MKIVDKILGLTLLISFLTLSTGCGQSGPLVLPEETPANDKSDRQQQQ